MEMTVLDEVVVTGERNRDEAGTLPGGFWRDHTNLGLMGDTDIMKVPYTAQSLSAKTISTMASPMGDMNQVLVNVPAVRGGTSPIKTDFSMRGMLANGSAMYLNDIPGFFIMAAGPVTNTIERADVLVGPAATLSGSVQSYNGPDGGQPGSVYLYTKRAGKDDFSRYTQTVGGYGSYGEYIDISRSRLGKDQSWGVRMYGQYDKGGLAIDGASREKKNLFIDISRKTETSETNIFGGYYDDRLYGTERRFSIARNSRWIPSAPDAGKSYDDPDVMHSDWYGWMLTLNHEQDLGDRTKWFLNAGMTEMTNRRFIFSSEIPINDKGEVTDAQLWAQYFLMKNRYIQTGFKKTVDTGIVEHNLTLSVDRSWRIQYNNNTTIDKKGEHVSGDIYHGIIFKPGFNFDNSAVLGKMFMYQEMDTSVNFIDHMTIGKWNVLGAVTRRHGNYRGKKAANQVKDDNWSPTFGVSYQPNEQTSLYAAYTEATTRGVPVTGAYDNAGDILDPVKVKQKELGVKYKWDRMYASVSYFDMVQPNYLDVQTESGTYKKIYALDGENRYKGVDFNITGQAARKWNLFGGFEYLHARQQNTAGGINDGMPTDSSAKWSAVLGAEYMPNEAWSLTARMNYTGEGVMVGNQRKELKVPSSTVFDFFARYQTQIGNTPVTVSASCYNVFNKSYWILQPGQGNKLMLSMPRTFVLSASFDF